MTGLAPHSTFMNTNDPNHPDNQIPDAEMPPENAMVVRDNTVPPPEKITPAQARIEAVADALKAAYAKASELKLTPDEATALAEDFPDEAFRLGAGGDPNLIYIEHAYLRMRLNKALGVGAAVPIRRREWAEEFQYYKDGARKTGVRVYADVVLVVRGCVVGEAIGDAVYYPDNAKTNYSDALESAKSAAFRRCCKEFGVGLQAWLKGWGEGWKARQRQHPTQAPKAAPSPTSAPKPATKTADLVPQEATPDQFQRFMALFNPVTRDFAVAYFKDKGWLPNTENAVLEELPLKYVPTTKKGVEHLIAEIEAFSTRPAADEESGWKSFLMPFGKNKDIPLGELDKKYLFGLAKNYQPSEEYNGQRKSDEAIARDQEFRAMLDEAMEEYGWTKDQ